MHQEKEGLQGPKIQQHRKYHSERSRHLNVKLVMKPVAFAHLACVLAEGGQLGTKTEISMDALAHLRNFVGTVTVIGVS